MVQSVYIEETPSTPEVYFNFNSHVLSIKGESYPENAAKFYGPVLASLKTYLASVENQVIEFKIALTYFNSTSTKILYNIMHVLEEATTKNNTIIVKWCYDEEDDTILEIGQELHEDYPAILFNPEPFKS
jgi:hypothetical protein